MAINGLTNAILQQDSSTAPAASAKPANPADTNPSIKYWYPSGYQTPDQIAKSAGKTSNQLPEYVTGSGEYQIPTADYVAPNQNLKNIMTSQLQEASDYQKNYPGQVNSQANLYNRNAKQNLSQGIQQTRQNFNTRGLLKSGQRQGAEYGQAANAAADMANNRYQLNQNALTTQNQLESNAYNTGLLYSGNAPGVGAEALSGNSIGVQNDITNMNNANTMTNAVGGALGSLAGAIGAQNKTTPSYGIASSQIGNYQIPNYQSPAGGLGVGY